jgi:hypothetical protein
MKAAIGQFRTQLGAAIDSVDPVKRALPEKRGLSPGNEKSPISDDGA